MIMTNYLHPIFSCSIAFGSASTFWVLLTYFLHPVASLYGGTHFTFPSLNSATIPSKVLPLVDFSTMSVGRDDLTSYIIPFSSTSVFIGSGYNVFEGQPGSAFVDPGIGIISPAILQKTIPPPTHPAFHTNSMCPDEAVCTHFPAPFHHRNVFHQSPIVAVIRNTQQYRRHLARHIRLQGTGSLNIVNVIGMLSEAYQGLSEDFDEGDVVIERKRSIVYENIMFQYRVHKTLTSSFINAVCELPENYDYTSYANLIMEFGTHVVVGVQAGEIAMEKVTVPRRIIQQEYREFKSQECPQHSESNYQHDSFRPSPAFLNAAASRLPANYTVHSVAGSAASPIPLTMVVRELTEFMTTDHFNESETPCFHLVLSDTLKKLRSNIKQALQEMAEKASAIALERTVKATHAAYPTCAFAAPIPQVDISNAVDQNYPEVIPAYLYNQRICGNGSNCGWPDGHYGLLRTKDATGCPVGNAQTSWITGRRFHKTPTGFGGSAEKHIDLGYQAKSSEIFVNFCMKRTIQYTIASSTVAPQPMMQWEPGSYCVFRSRRGPCPEGFQSGTLFFNDVKLASRNDAGEMPEGEPYRCHDDRNEPHFCGTLYKFCCRNDGDAEVPIRLPSQRPFVLFPKTMTCQEIAFMRVRHVWLPVFSETNTVQQISGDNLPFFTQHNSIPNLLYWHLCYYYK